MFHVRDVFFFNPMQIECKKVYGFINAKGTTRHHAVISPITDRTVQPFLMKSTETSGIGFPVAD